MEFVLIERILLSKKTSDSWDFCGFGIRANFESKEEFLGISCGLTLNLQSTEQNFTFWGV